MYKYIVIASIITFADGTPSLTTYEPDTFIGKAGTQLRFAYQYADITVTWAAGKTDPIVKPSKTAPVEIVSTDAKRFNSFEGLARVLKNNPFLKLEIGCHTDAAEKPSINEKLSSERADKIKRALIKLGVDSLQLRPVAYAGTIVDKWYTKTPTQSNIRRVELRITGRIDKPDFSFSDTAALPLQKKNFNYVFDYNKSMPGAGDSNPTLNDYKISNEKYIDSIVGFLNRNNEIKIILVNYTDQRGNSGFNSKLALTRAKRVANEIIKKGIHTNRISVFGAGEWNPVTTLEKMRTINSPMEEEIEYAKSRRMEIIIDIPVILK